jgi:hypothetical protein
MGWGSLHSIYDQALDRQMRHPANRTFLTITEALLTKDGRVDGVVHRPENFPQIRLLFALMEHLRKTEGLDEVAVAWSTWNRRHSRSRCSDPPFLGTGLGTGRAVRTQRSGRGSGRGARRPRSERVDELEHVVGKFTGAVAAAKRSIIFRRPSPCWKWKNSSCSTVSRMSSAIARGEAGPGGP